MRSTRLPWCVHLSLISPACQYPQDAVGPPEASDSSQTSVPDPETIAPTTAPGGQTTGQATSDGPESPTTSDGPSETTTTTGTVDPTTTTTTAPPPASCGDGILDPGESCDLGVGLNHDQDGGCTQGCRLPVCGDGLVHTGQEQCDNALANNSLKYGGCSEKCELNDRCGDGELQPEHEECDASAPPVKGKAPCGATCAHPFNWTFRGRFVHTRPCLAA